MVKYIIAALTALTVQAGAQAENYSPIGTGSFVSVGTKMTKGELQVVEHGQEVHLKFSANFSTQEGPDLRVVLRDSTGAHQMIVVESLKSFSGAQEYVLPISKHALSNFDQVVIYCAEFHVDFGIATLQRHFDL